VDRASKALKITMTYTSYPLDAHDWRGRFIFDLVAALSRRNDIQLSVFGPPGPIPVNTNYIGNQSEANWMRNLLERGGIAHIFRQGVVSGYICGIKLLQLLRRIYKKSHGVDIFHVNWLQNIIPLIGTKTPLVVSVLGTDHQLLSKPFMVKLLRRVIGQRRCIIAPNADWMIPDLNLHFGDLAEIRLISFGVHPGFFNITRSPDMSHQKWLVVLRLTRDKIGPLFDWGKKLFQNGSELHLFGPMQEDVTIPDWVHYHGPTYPETLREKWFPVATGLITLSRHAEGRPQIILEAMASGLPVIASAIPAHCNILQKDVTGKLVDSHEEFSAAIEELTVSENNMKLGETAKKHIKQEIGSWDDCADRYFNAYQDLLGDK